ncbi:PapB/FocB family fimbrial expression transcriptional regulator [Salmonella enterica]|uniref:PapB/FocB family fimbrial expression transcriptional regulator n=1 Tax=Salmonella enterica TaxID=28901 RepID=UPI0026DC12C9|nr:PapB/FocB family fimbrial expression transcriptional regulator [Salmonella enterica]MDO3872080.1 PapB/FocB family fimbrial expression transcriptional regulator [Salmonella enterica]MDO3886844.1 PapB/FocB family fimbrial expression transcriptional regulator [Salmonella enterica]MDO3900037.1 PapB/FocB family fimbrial expression transcriptional regulator [Salmonella enterica]MDO3976205.1 PapB/FocB family fimbrial expression transcriptional regulator [Salmonella enterica]
MSDYGDVSSASYQKTVNLSTRKSEKEGVFSNEQFDLLVELSSIHSQKVILAMRDHFVKGDSRKTVCERYGVNAGYLSVCINRLLRVEKGVSKLVRFYCCSGRETTRVFI